MAKRLGQYFLKNKSAVKKIVAALELRAGETVVEIGAGHGELTRELRFRNYDLRIIAIEKDSRLVRELQKKFSSDKNITIIEGDVLKILPSIIRTSPFINRNYKLIGNIPYYLTGKLLRIVGDLRQKPLVCVFTLQKEVGERIIARPPLMNRLAAHIQFWAEPEIVIRLSKEHFAPKPHVDSAAVRLVTRAPHERQRAPAYHKMVSVLFQQPRKTVLNNLRAACAHKEKTSKTGGQETGRTAVADALEQMGIKPESRPHNLSVKDITLIARRFAP